MLDRGGQKGRNENSPDRMGLFQPQRRKAETLLLAWLSASLRSSRILCQCPLMSPLGQKRTSARTSWNVRFTPKSGHVLDPLRESAKCHKRTCPTGGGAICSHRRRRPGTIKISLRVQMEAASKLRPENNCRGNGRVWREAPRLAASSTSRKEESLPTSSTTESSTPSFSVCAFGEGTKTGSPG